MFGTEGELLALLSEKLQFKLNLIEFKDMPDIWKEMVDAVSHRRVDWAVGGITESLDRIKITDFTHFIRPEPFTALFSVYEDIWMSWQNILMPFQLVVWIVLSGTTLAIALLLYSTIKLTYDGKNKSLLFYMQVIIVCSFKNYDICDNIYFENCVYSFIILFVLFF